MRISDWSSDVCPSDPQALDRLHLLTIDFTDDDLGARHRQLVAFAAHGFDHDRQMQLAAAGHLELVGILGIFHLQRHVVLGFAHQPIAQLARSEEHTSELQSLMRLSYAVFCLKKTKDTQTSTLKSQEQTKRNRILRR